MLPCESEAAWRRQQWRLPTQGWWGQGPGAALCATLASINQQWVLHSWTPRRHCTSPPCKSWQTGGWSTCGRVRLWRENYSLGGQYVDSKKGGKEKDSTKGHPSALIVSAFTSFALPFWLCVIHLAVYRGGTLQHVSYLSF